MKLTYKGLYSLLLSFLIFSCSTKDELITEEEEGNLITATESCLYSDFAVEANRTVTIDCLLDLAGEIIEIPSGVSFEFEGGDIFNGTLNFSEGGKIAGEILNSNLEVTGDVSLISDDFQFYASRWDIVEGKTTDEISLHNRENMNKSIETVHRLKGSVFIVGKLDAYFNVEANKINRFYHSERSIRIPSDFHFKMADDTFLRVQPTHFPSYSLLTTYLTDNTIISGGNLIGDRWEHDYTPITDIAGVDRDDHGYGFGIWVIGTHNSVVDNVTINGVCGDGIIIHSKTIRTSDGLLVDGNRTSENIIIKKCKIIESRRNGIAVIDADGIIIDDCDIIDTGKGDQAYDSSGEKIFTSAGTAPRDGIDLEALRYINDDGTKNIINKIENISIKNSRFYGNEGGDITVYTASFVTIDNNFFNTSVGSFASDNVTISNNTFEARDPELSYAVSVPSRIDALGKELNHHFTITKNTISGYRDGIKLAAQEHTVSFNKINNCITGLQMGTLKDTEIFGNEYKSNLEVSYGINPFPNSTISNVSIRDEYIDVTNRPINLRGVNSTTTVTTNQLTFDNCEFYTNSKNFFLHIEDSKNLTIKNSIMNTGLQVINSTNIVESSNTLVDM